MRQKESITAISRGATMLSRWGMPGSCFKTHEVSKNVDLDVKIDQALEPWWPPH